MDFAISQPGLNLSDCGLCKFAVWLESLRRFGSLASLPVESRPCFLGWHLDGVGPLPPPAATLTTARRQGPPVGRRARGTRTATLAYVQKTLHLGALLLATLDGQPVGNMPQGRHTGIILE